MNKNWEDNSQSCATNGADQCDEIIQLRYTDCHDAYKEIRREHISLEAGHYLSRSRIILVLSLANSPFILIDGCGGVADIFATLTINRPKLSLISFHLNSVGTYMLE